MGLSASQARLISLEARMSDVEYEGQQINQQRLVLSNKMNEIQERVYNMDVPTPPSKQDFMYDVYTGKTRGGKPVKVTINGDGSLNVAQTKTGTIVTKGDMVYVTNGTVVNSTTTNVDGQTVNVPAGMELRTRTLGEVFDEEDYGREFKVTIPSVTKETETITDQNTIRKLKENGSFGSYKVVAGVTTFTENGKDSENNITYDPIKVETGNLKQSGTETLTISADGTLSKSTYCTGEFSGYSLNGMLDIPQQTCTTAAGNNYNVTKMQDLAKNALNEVGFRNINKYYNSDPQCSQGFTWGQLVEDTDTYQVKKSVKTYDHVKKAQTNSQNATAVADGETTVAGKKIMTIDEVTELYGADQDSSWSKCLSGLEQTMGTYNSKEGHREFDKNAWRVIVTTKDNGQATFSFVKAEDVAKGEGAQIQEYVTQQGDYEEDPTTIKANDPNVEYDPDTGHITKIKVDGQDIIMMYGQECNENEYEKAHNKYLYMKSLYDQEQNELNKQTSIYQRQDKQLELKLTRLDTERNSLNTEIEAVKKVIQDAAEDFKTFSG